MVEVETDEKSVEDEIARVFFLIGPGPLELIEKGGCSIKEVLCVHRVVIQH